MNNLTFKSTQSAFEYAKKYFAPDTLRCDLSYIGIVRMVEDTRKPAVHMVEIACRSKMFFNVKEYQIVAAIQHPELHSEISESDLVVVGLDNVSGKIPSGYILHKLIPELEKNLSGFKVAPESKKFKVFVDDNFHFADSEERYLHGEFENVEDAIAVCKKIIDESLDSLSATCKLDELLDKYLSFGDSPFIEGDPFSSTQYARFRVNELIKERANRSQGPDVWRFQIDHTYGMILKESEIFEQRGIIYFRNANGKKLIAGWDSIENRWITSVGEEILRGAEFSTAKRFEELVFNEESDFENYRKKQFLIEYLLNGKSRGELKKLSVGLGGDARIEFHVDSVTWNEMLIGNPVAVESGICDYFEGAEVRGKPVQFAFFCKSWNFKTEVIIGEYEDFVQTEVSLKELGHYYG